MTGTRERSPLRAVQEDLDDAAALHDAHRRVCRQRGCAECKSLAGDVLRLQHQTGLIRFEGEDPEDVR